jgi:AcrR family transcriptional regulator
LDARQAGRRRLSAELRRTIQESGETTAALARRHGLDPKTVRRWRSRSSPQSRKPGPRDPGPTALSPAAAAAVAAFRLLTRLPLDDCHYVLGALIPGLSRATLYRCLRRFGLARRDRAPEPPGGFELHRLELSDAPGGPGLIVGVDGCSRFLAVRLVSATDADRWGGIAHALAASPGCRVLADRAALTPGERAALRRSCEAAGLRLRWREPQAGGEVAEMVLASGRRALASLLADGGADALADRLASFAARYNHGCRLKALGGRTPADALDADVRRAADAPRRGGRGPAKRRAPRAKREAMLEAARALIAKAGPEGLSLSEVARLAGVNRGTAYQHFKTRAQLIAETTAWSSEQLEAAVFRSAGAPGDRADVAGVIHGLAGFAIHNPEICRAWLFQVLSSPDPAKDGFWREYLGRAARFHETPMAAPGIDAEVLSVIILAGAFLWPIWARAKCKDAADLPRFADRFAREFLRLALYGTVRREFFPELAEELQAN